LVSKLEIQHIVCNAKKAILGLYISLDFRIIYFFGSIY